MRKQKGNVKRRPFISNIKQIGDEIKLITEELKEITEKQSENWCEELHYRRNYLIARSQYLAYCFKRSISQPKKRLSQTPVLEPSNNFALPEKEDINMDKVTLAAKST